MPFKNTKQVSKYLPAVIKSNRELRNKFRSNTLMELGLQEEAMKLQKPTIDAIGANALATQKTIQDETKKQLEQLELMKRTQENEGELTRQLLAHQSQNQNQNQQQLPNSDLPELYSEVEIEPRSSKFIQPRNEKNPNLAYGYVLRPIERRYTEFGYNLQQYVFRKAGVNANRYTIAYDKDGNAIITNMTIRSDDPAKIYRKLTPGLKSIMFEDGEGAIPTKEDMRTWEEMMEENGIKGHYRNLNMYKAFDALTTTSNVTQSSPTSSSTPYVTLPDDDEEFSTPSTTPKKGKGLKKQLPITIPSDPDELRHDLLLQLAATRAGNNNTFNHTNAILKEMMRQKLLKANQYRDILRTYFMI